VRVPFGVPTKPVVAESSIRPLREASISAKSILTLNSHLGNAFALDLRRKYSDDKCLRRLPGMLEVAVEVRESRCRKLLNLFLTICRKSLIGCVLWNDTGICEKIHECPFPPFKLVIKLIGSVGEGFHRHLTGGLLPTVRFYRAPSTGNKIDVVAAISWAK
jgi:hypothetical protein